jgi:hypothetical protein
LPISLHCLSFFLVFSFPFCLFFHSFCPFS